MTSAPLLSIDEALQAVLSATSPLPPIEFPLTEANGLFLAEEVHADLDIPPFNKATMDGYTLRSSECAPGAILEVIGRTAAGEVPPASVPPGCAVKIMTGAPVPSDCDAVLQIELTTALPDGRVRCESAITSGRNIAPRGEEMTVGERVFGPGTEITPSVAGVLATCGAARVRVSRRPQLAILTTGSELVPPEVTPGPGMIRDSNSFSLSAQAWLWGALSDRPGSTADTRETLASAIRRGLERDILILSGGVSMGDFDLVPEVLAALGCDIRFHKVAQKPGKPLLFATHGTTLIFGLPGNPVSTLVSFELYVGPAIRKMLGDPAREPRWRTGHTTAPINVHSDRALLRDVAITEGESGWTLTPIASLGSADLRAVTRADGLMRLEAGTYILPADSRVPFVFYRGKGHGA